MQRETGMGIIRNLVIKREEDDAGCTLSWRSDTVFVQCGGVRHLSDVISTVLHELAHHMVNRSTHNCENDHCDVWIHCAKIMTSIFRKAVIESSFRWLGSIKQDYGAAWATKLVQSETACNCPKSADEEQNAKQQKEYDTEPAHIILYTSTQLNSIFKEKIRQDKKKKVPEE